MLHASPLAVEITRKDDSLDIWVDANNNGERDDDDVNIYVTAGGGFYTISPTFKHPLDANIQARIKEVATSLINNPNSEDEQMLRDLSLELVIRATMETDGTQVVDV